MKKQRYTTVARLSRSGKILKVLIVIITIAAAAAAGGWWFLQKGDKNTDFMAGTFAVKRVDLTISIIENGDIIPVNSKDIKSEVEGNNTIISLVDEGTYITPEDVKNGKILVELDSSQIKAELTEEEMKFLQDKADLTEAIEALDIQKKQNESDIEAGRMKVHFGLMDLQKYLGEIVASKFINVVEQQNKKQNEDNNDLTIVLRDPNLGEIVASKIGSTENKHEDKQSKITEAVYVLITDPNLGGEALQKLRQLENDITLTDARLARAKDKFEGTKELYDSNYVAEIELKGDEYDVDSLEIQKRQDETAKYLFEKYEFPKFVQQLFSDYVEAKRELERIEASARSKLAQAEARLESRQAKYILQKADLEKARRQLKACTIRAPSPGEVVYASSTEHRSRGSSPEPIEVGAQIRERQKMISIPDTSQMKVEIKIHETWIDKVEVGQKAKIMIPAFQEERFTGKVIRKAPLADPESWMNPDLKVYSTDVSIDGTYEFIKTGMSAKVEIILLELKDVLSAPIQSVVNIQGQKVCYVPGAGGPQKRIVETGAFNNDFVEIKKGLKEGESVLLNPPRLFGSQKAVGKPEEKETGDKPEEKEAGKPKREKNQNGEKRRGNAGSKRKK